MSKKVILAMSTAKAMSALEAAVKRFSICNGDKAYETKKEVIGPIHAPTTKDPERVVEVTIFCTPVRVTRGISKPKPVGRPRKAAKATSKRVRKPAAVKKAMTISKAKKRVSKPATGRDGKPLRVVKAKPLNKVVSKATAEAYLNTKPKKTSKAFTAAEARQQSPKPRKPVGKRTKAKK